MEWNKENDCGSIALGTQRRPSFTAEKTGNLIAAAAVCGGFFHTADSCIGVNTVKNGHVCKYQDQEGKEKGRGQFPHPHYIKTFLYI